jgi:hypothetical protein
MSSRPPPSFAERINVGKISDPAELDEGRTATMHCHCLAYMDSSYTREWSEA